MHLLLSLMFVSVLSAPGSSNKSASDDHLLIEHSVTQESAENAIQHLKPDLMIGAGCKECTRREIEYCLSSDVIEDHCCCQRKYHGILYSVFYCSYYFEMLIYFTEVFPYIAHTCYVRSRNCEPTVRDCGVFDRLLACCCHHHLGMKWKSQMSTTSPINGQGGKRENFIIVIGLIILLFY
ncbi:Hypothetical protein CINCED_3A018654 [Cinara cedri]|uniref:CCC domain-containing protein n=1 Tax=Cinara cedri TaxID=506608 RepID=A0A5E4N2R7_9HEMI|nr:Hypothetical protein CINCED_3A018654 [Cinara cedri]